MSPCYPFRPIPGQCGPHRRGPLPAPPFDPQDYWATKKLVSSLFGSLDARIRKLENVTAPLDGATFRLDKNEDLYRALERIIPALGGTVEVD